MARKPSGKVVSLPVAKLAAPKMKEELGVSGLKVSSGYIYEEFVGDLRGANGIKVFTEMSLNDATCGALLNSISLILRAVSWDAEIPKDVPEAEGQEAKDFALSLLDDMSHSWEDFIAECLTMLSYGWSFFEIVTKRRVGPLESDPQKRSRYDDGLIGIRKLAPRSQDTMEKWEMQDDGGISGLWQVPWDQGGRVFLPIERCLLFRTTSRKNSPEGVSILRTAYRYFYDLKNIEMYEAIGIERELAGLPVVSIPMNYLSAADGPNLAIKQAYEKVARDIKLNEQGGVVIPSNTFPDRDGNPSGVPMVKIELLTSGGSRAINTDVTIQRKQRGIARSMLADFLMLGEGSGTARGSYGMSESKIDFFIRACESILRQIAYPLNNFLLPRIWALNGKDYALMPKLTPGKLVKEDLARVGAFLRDLTQAGEQLFPDDELSDYLRSEANLPLKSEDAKAQQEDQKAVEDEMRRQELESGALSNEQQQFNLDNPPPPKPVVKGFNPNQPRDPAGSETGGQWSAGFTPVSQAYADEAGIKGKPTQSKVRKQFEDHAKRMENHLSTATMLMQKGDLEAAKKIFGYADKEHAKFLALFPKVDFKSGVITKSMGSASNNFKILSGLLNGTIKVPVPAVPIYIGSPQPVSSVSAKPLDAPPKSPGPALTPEHPHKIILPDEEFKALKFYKGNGYDTINGRLRLGAKSEQAQYIDAALAKVSYPEDGEIYRGISTHHGNLLSNLKPGDEFDDRGYMSFSRREAVAGGFSGGTILKMEIKKGERAFSYRHHFGTYDGEEEVLLPRGTLLRVKEVKPKTFSSHKTIVVERVK